MILTLGIIFIWQDWAIQTDSIKLYGDNIVLVEIGAADSMLKLIQPVSQMFLASNLFRNNISFPPSKIYKFPLSLFNKKVLSAQDYMLLYVHYTCFRRKQRRVLVMRTTSQPQD